MNKGTMLMSKAILNNRMQEKYQDRRNLAEARVRRDQATYLEAHTDLKEYIDNLASTRWDQLEAIIDNAPIKGFDRYLASPEELKYESLNLQDTAVDEDNPKYKEYLALADAYYACSVCKDQGRLADNTKCPNCYGKTWREVLAENLSVGIPDANANFADFDIEIFSDTEIAMKQNKTTQKLQMQENLSLANNFVKNFPDGKSNLYFNGKTGTGKTYLAQAIANALIDKGALALMYSSLEFEEIINNLRIKQKTYSVKAEELEAVQNAYNLLLEADLLVIDDFGVLAGILQNPLAEILNMLRERSLRGKQTIITSNLSIFKLKEVFDERLFSRLLDSFRIIPFLGEDIRLRRR